MTNSALVSMTGYGAGRIEDGSLSVDIQLRGINSRYLDCVFRLPKLYNSLEGKLRTIIVKYIGRGKVEVSINRTISGQTESSLKLNKGRFQEYLKYYRDLLVEHGGGCSKEEMNSVIPEILKMTDVWEKGDTEQQISEQEEANVLKQFEATVGEFLKSRQSEGSILEKDIRLRLENVKGIVEKVSLLAPAVDEVREKLNQKLAQYKGDVSIDPQRIAQEVVFIVDRGDFSEEVIRFRAHHEQMLQSLKPQSGKKIEFLLQEMMRECNTIASKSSRAEISSLIVEAKVELEKIREQLQNVE